MVQRLVDHDLIQSEPVRQAMLDVPRHLFVPPAERARAYEDTPLPIGEGQVITAPHLVARMLEALDLAPGMRVLEVGGGSGYHAACIGAVVRTPVASIERIPSLAHRARRSLLEAGFADLVRLLIADGSAGLPRGAPFDRIQVAAAARGVPKALLDQLASRGLLLVPVGSLDHQELMRVRRDGSAEALGGVVFVPLVEDRGL